MSWRIAALGVVLASTASGAMAAGGDPILIAVSVPPQAYFVERIGGDRVRTVVMIPPGASDETYAPSPAQMASLNRARLYLKVGHPDYVFEARYIDPFLRRHPAIEVIDMAQGVKFIDAASPTGGEGAPRKSTRRGPGSYETDPHIWVAPYTVQVAARNIAQRLSALDAAHASEYRLNLERFVADIQALNRDVEALLAGTARRTVMVTHPVWGYLTAQFGLEQIAIETDGKEPGPARAIALIEAAKRHGIRTVFVQAGSSRKSAELIAGAVAGRVVELDPLARDWLPNTRAVAAAFASALRDD